MVKKQSYTYDLPPETIIEVVRTKKGEVPVVKEMTYREWKELKRQPGYVYKAYQKGFSCYK